MRCSSNARLMRRRSPRPPCGCYHARLAACEWISAAIARGQATAARAVALGEAARDADAASIAYTILTRCADLGRYDRCPRRLRARAPRLRRSLRPPLVCPRLHSRALGAWLPRPLGRGAGGRRGSLRVGEEYGDAASITRPRAISPSSASTRAISPTPSPTRSAPRRRPSRPSSKASRPASRRYRCPPRPDRGRPDAPARPRGRPARRRLRAPRGRGRRPRRRDRLAGRRHGPCPRRPRRVWRVCRRLRHARQSPAAPSASSARLRWPIPPAAFRRGDRRPVRHRCGALHARHRLARGPRRRKRAALALAGYGHLLARQGDRAAARTHLARALAILTRLGTQGAPDVVARTLAALEPAPR